MTMGKPVNNGLVELIDERKSDSRAWMCMDLLKFLSDEEDKSWEHIHSTLLQAKAGNCKYSDQCPRYKRTIENQNKNQIN